MTTEERSKLHDLHDKTVGAETVEQMVEEALDHQAAKKSKTEYFYVRKWLRTEVPRVAADAARLAKAKLPYGTVASEPSVPPTADRRFLSLEESKAIHARRIEEAPHVVREDGLPRAVAS
jgi:hypothetical protein